MHEHLGVVVALQVVVAFGEYPGAELAVVGDIAVEAKCEPLPLAAVLTLERLGVLSIVAAARGVTDVTDAGAAAIAVHDVAKLGRIGKRQAKDVRHAAHVLVSVEDFRLVLVVARDTSSE